MAAVALVCLALVALHVLIAENQFRLDRLEQQAVVQQEAYEKLRLQVAQLEAPARIFSVAEGKLGMQQPGSVTYLPALPAPLSKGQPARAASPQGDADWPMIKPFLSGSP
jgi:cell division protein FtsL